MRITIRKTALSNIALVIKELTSHSGLAEFFADFGISEAWYAAGSKYDRVFSVLSNVEQETLFKIIEEAVHPLKFFGGNKEEALRVQDTLSSFLEFDGYCIHNGKVVEAKPKLVKVIEARRTKREKGGPKEPDHYQVSNDEKHTAKTLSVAITSMPKLEIEGLEKLPQNKKKQIKEGFLYLNQVGDLYKEPKDKHCYPMGENSDRHKIVRYLAENKGYQPTLQISLNLEGKSENSIRREIGKINQIAKGKLGIKDKVIEGRKESGYRINPKQKISIKNE